jgi:hypothetical protein
MEILDPPVNPVFLLNGNISDTYAGHKMRVHLVPQTQCDIIQYNLYVVIKQVLAISLRKN